jgi:hypothetical protein
LLPPNINMTLSNATTLAPFLLTFIGLTCLQMFSAKEYLSQESRSYSPLWPPNEYKHESDKQNIEGKNALLKIIGGFSMRLLYLLNNIVLFEKLSSESLPPKINIPKFLGKWVIEEKNKNLDVGNVFETYFQSFEKVSNLKMSIVSHLGQYINSGDGICWYNNWIYWDLVRFFKDFECYVGNGAVSYYFELCLTSIVIYCISFNSP